MNAAIHEATLAIGTRGSPLALAQAHETQRRLAATLGREADAFPLDVITTTGDAITDRALSEAGGKGLFTKEIDAAQLAGRVAIAVHSAKDLPTALPPGLVIAGYLPREDVRDAFIGGAAARIEDLPAGAVVGSASLRRQALLRRLRPDIEVALLRGNVGTRLSRVAQGDFAGTLLALAGLRRLGLEARATQVLDIDTFLPAVGQGAIALVTREADAAARDAVAAIACPVTGAAVTAERAFLTVLDGSCRTPIAGHARIVEGALRFRGLVLSPDGRQAVEVERHGVAADAALLGEDAGRDTLARMPAGLLPGLLAR
jgi:hydroxymethylbilane synthase